MKQIEHDIEAVTLAGADAVRDLQGDINQLELEKARLMKQNLGLEQTIRENKRLVSKLY